MLVKTSHFTGGSPVGAIACGSVDTLKTAGAESISSIEPIGSTVVEVVADQPCFIRFASDKVEEADIIDDDMLLFLDARDLADTYADAEAIVSWADKSGNSSDAAEATTPPVYDEDGLDGTYPSAHFDGTTTFLNATIAATDSKLTVMVVGKLDNAAGTATIIGVTPDIVLQYDADNDVFDYTDGTTNATDDGVLQDAPFLLTASPSGIWQNGALLQDVMTLADKTITAVSIGADAANTGGFVDGEISAVLIYKGDLAEEKRQAAEGYIAREFGIALDASHPYASAYPKRSHATAASGIYMPANTVRRFVVNRDDYISVIRAGSTDASVYITTAAEI